MVCKLLKRFEFSMQISSWVNQSARESAPHGAQLGSKAYMKLGKFGGLAFPCWNVSAFARARLIARGRACLAFGTAAAMLGCAVPSSEWRDYASGWRKGYISKIGPSSTITSRVDGDCRLSSAIANKYESYAAVTYLTRRGALERRVVPLLPAAKFKKGDWVTLNINECERLELQ